MTTPSNITFRLRPPTVRRAADKGTVGKDIVTWERLLNEQWGTLRFGDVKAQTNAGEHDFEAEVYLNDLDPNLVRVELYAEGIDGGRPFRQEMTRAQSPAGERHRQVYHASVSAMRPATDYTARIIPHRAGVAVPLEVDPILWQR